LTHLRLVKVLKYFPLDRPDTIVFGRTYVLPQMFYFFQRKISEMRRLIGVKFCMVMVLGRIL